MKQQQAPSLQKRFEQALGRIHQSTVEEQLDLLIEEYNEFRNDDGEDEGWSEELAIFRSNPDVIKQHIRSAIADEIRFDQSALDKFFKNLKKDLPFEWIRSNNIAVVRYGEHEKVHLDLHCRNACEPLFRNEKYSKKSMICDVTDPRVLIGETCIRSAKLYDHPLDESELFMSIGSEYFGDALWLRQLRLEQDLLRKTTFFLQSAYPMERYLFLIGDYHNELRVV